MYRWEQVDARKKGAKLRKKMSKESEKGGKMQMSDEQQRELEIQKRR